MGPRDVRLAAEAPLVLQRPDARHRDDAHEVPHGAELLTYKSCAHLSQLAAPAAAVPRSASPKVGGLFSPGLPLWRCLKLGEPREAASSDSIAQSSSHCTGMNLSRDRGVGGTSLIPRGGT